MVNRQRNANPARAQPRPKPRKGLGQHFLTNLDLLNFILDAAVIGPRDTVVEVGPGLGSLTGLLAGRAHRVVAIELDTELAALLRAKLPPNVEVHEADARQVTVEELLGGCVDYKLVGNLPYYAATPILRHFLESRCRPSVAVVMLQREVAREVCAEPGRMSLLSVGVQLYGRPRLVRIIRPGAFRPPPKVTSAVVAIEVYPQPAEGIGDTEGFFQVVCAGFSAPRKQLRNSLANGLAVSSSQSEQLLSQAAIEPRRRAETLSLAEWAQLYRCWHAQRHPTSSQ